MTIPEVNISHLFGPPNAGPAPDPNIISAITGSANMRTSTTEFYVFFVPVDAVRGMVETFIGKACKELQGFADSPIRQHGGLQVVDSLNGIPREIGGAFATCSYAITDGTVLKIMAKRRNGVGQPMVNTVQYIRCRKGAAYRSIVLSCVPNNSLTLRAMELRGNFDLISADEVVALGGSVNPISRNMANGNHHIMTYTETSPAVVAPVIHEEVRGSDGETIMVPVQQRIRQIEK